MTILFVPNTGSPVFRIAEKGGAPVAVTSLASPKVSDHHFPHALPDSRHFLYYTQGTADVRGVYLGDLAGGQATRLLDADVAAMYASGQLLFVRQDKLLSQHLDIVSGTLDGPIVPVVEHIARSAFASAALAAASVSRAGPIVYRTQVAPTPIQTSMRWSNRDGTAVDPIRESPTLFLNPALSPDASRVALFMGSDIWIHDLGTRTNRKFTFDPKNDFAAVWSRTARASSSARTGAATSISI